MARRTQLALRKRDTTHRSFEQAINPTGVQSSKSFCEAHGVLRRLARRAAIRSRRTVRSHTLEYVDAIGCCAIKAFTAVLLRNARYQLGLERRRRNGWLLPTVPWSRRHMTMSYVSDGGGSVSPLALSDASSSDHALRSLPVVNAVRAQALSDADCDELLSDFAE